MYIILKIKICTLLCPMVHIVDEDEKFINILTICIDTVTLDSDCTLLPLLSSASCDEDYEI